MRRFVLSFFVSVLACALSACGGRATPEPTGTPQPTSTPEPTYTLLPTYTPYPTHTPEPTYTPAPTSTPVPTRTVVPISTPEPANTPTPFPVVSLGEEVQTTGLLVTISEARRAEWLPRNGQTLEPAGQWIIAYGEVRNLTAEPAWLYPEDFVLGVSSIGGYIFLSEDATEAAGLQSGIERTVAGTFGMDIPPGESAPVALAFDVSDVVGQTTLWVVDARAGIALGSIGQIASLWTPTPTGTPIPTNTPTSTPTPTALPNVPLDATRAQLIGLVDGDTIEVLVNGQAETVRYIGIDTPERTQPGYEAATEANRTLLSAGPIYLVRDRSDRDRYDRLLRYVYTADGAFVNAEMVAQGWAQPVEYSPDTLHAAEFRQLAREAAEAGRGFWSETSLYDSLP